MWLLMLWYLQIVRLDEWERRLAQGSIIEAFLCIGLVHIISSSLFAFVGVGSAGWMSEECGKQKEEAKTCLCIIESHSRPPKLPTNFYLISICKMLNIVPLSMALKTYWIIFVVAQAGWKLCLLDLSILAISSLFIGPRSNLWGWI